MMDQAPEISVGIVSGSGLTFTLNGQFYLQSLPEENFQTSGLPCCRMAGSCSGTKPL